MHEHSSTSPENASAISAESRLVIVGTDADARLALDIAAAYDAVVYGFMTDNAEDLMREINDVSVLMRIDAPDGKKFLDNEQVEVVVAERETSKRQQLARKLESRKVEIINLFHPSMVLSPYSSLGKGNLIGANCVIQANSHIGSFNSIQANTVIDSDVTMGEFCTLQSGVQIGRGVKIEDDVFVGAGAVIFAGMKIGKGAFIAPGAVVLTSVAAGGKVAGNPAKPV